jgi:5-methyltetrahydrofolate--homocysteine methyltransferase
MTLNERLKQEVLILDGAMGTELLRRTGQTFDFPENLNIEQEKTIVDIHHAYIQAGADIIETNTFGANRIKLAEHNASDRVAQLNKAGLQAAKKARGKKNVFIAGSMGPVGKLIRPLGDAEEESVHTAYSEQARILEEGGADLLLIETQIDILEAKIALRAASETTSLPIALCLSFPLEGGRTVTGSDAETAAITFSSAAPDFLGINCGGNPEEFEALIKRFQAHNTKPLFVYANAGLPEKRGNLIVYPLGPEAYAKYAQKFHALGANVIGGCCGTTPDHIRALSDRLKGKKPLRAPDIQPCFRASSRYVPLTIGSSLPFKIIGENINPFGRKKLQQELEQKKLDQVREMARTQEKAGADALDINLGQVGEQDPEFYATAIRQIQNITKLPLFLDNSSPDALGQALKTYAGKAVINSINGKPESYETLFPLAKKFGAGVVLLALDESGIPENAKDRYRVIEDLCTRALDAGLSKQDILADPVVLTIATSQNLFRETLKTIEMIKSLGIPTLCGLSNFSFGLPQRGLLNACFLCMTMERGLDSAITNPLDEYLMAVQKGCDAIIGRDKSMRAFIQLFGKKFDTQTGAKPQQESLPPEKELYNAVLEGEKGKAVYFTKTLMRRKEKGFEILQKILTPALRQAGSLYQKKTYFLPQLVMSAEAMEAATKVLENTFTLEEKADKKLKIVLATVRGDLHDIGKNIVSLVLRNYGYAVRDLGKNVEAETILRAAKDEEADLIGLSALMSSTMEEMRKVVQLRDKKSPHTKIIIGGAAVSPGFAKEIGADAYGKDAMDAIQKIQTLTGKKQ